MIQQLFTPLNLFLLGVLGMVLVFGTWGIMSRPHK